MRWCRGGHLMCWLSLNEYLVLIGGGMYPSAPDVFYFVDGHVLFALSVQRLTHCCLLSYFRHASGVCCLLAVSSKKYAKTLIKEHGFAVDSG